MSRKNRPPRDIVPIQSAELRFQAMMRASYSGPLPPPEFLERYNLTLPGLAERIIKMAESQHDHRLEIERKVIEANISAQRLGTYCGFAVAMTAILGGIGLIFIGKEATGLTSILTALVSLVGVFIIGKRQQKKELDEKSEAIAKTAPH